MGRSAGQDGSPKGKRVAEGEMVRWHHRLSGHAFEQTPREWGTGKPGVLQSVGAQRVGHDLAAEQQQEREKGVQKQRLEQRIHAAREERS